MAAEGSAEGDWPNRSRPVRRLRQSRFLRGGARSFARAMRQASRYSIGGSPTLRVNRSKNAERDSAASLASCATVHWRVGSPCIRRIASASRASLKPRSNPGGASGRCVDRSASISTTSTRRASTRSRPARCSLASSLTSRTRIESRSAPRTCTCAGSSDTNNPASSEFKHEVAAHQTRARISVGGAVANLPRLPRLRCWDRSTGALPARSLTM